MDTQHLSFSCHSSTTCGAVGTNVVSDGSRIVSPLSPTYKSSKILHHVGGNNRIMRTFLRSFNRKQLALNDASKQSGLRVINRHTQRTNVRGRRYNDIISNNKADELATWYREVSGKRQSIESTDHVPGTQISISINSVRIVGQVDSCLRYHINGYHLRRYTQSKYKWNDQTWNCIDVEALGRYHSRLPPAEQIAHTK